MTALAVALLAGQPSFGAPADATFEERFFCAGEIEGTDLALPETLPLDVSWTSIPLGHPFRATGAAETRGIFPQASIDLASEGLIGGSPGSSRESCRGDATVIYEVEVRHDTGTAARSVPLLIGTRGRVSTSASSWGSKISAFAHFRLTPLSGGTVTGIVATGCSGTALSGCGSLPVNDGFDRVVRKDVMVPAGAGATEILEVFIRSGAGSNVFVQIYTPPSSEPDRAGSASATAWIDPVVWIDPTWEHAHEYSLAQSPGIGAAPDGDLDGVPDDFDNCIDVENPDQADFDAPEDDDTSLEGVQHYGDACDADLDDDGVVGPSDFFSVFRPCLGADLDLVPDCAEADLDGDGVVAPSDFFGRLRPALGSAPGPGISDPP